MKFYNPFKINIARLQDLETKLASLAKKVERRDNDIRELKDEVNELAQVKPEMITSLRRRVVLLEERQSQLRDRVGELFIAKASDE